VLITWLTYVVFVWCHIGPDISNILSWICGVLFAFFVNKLIVFRSRSMERKVLLREFYSFMGFRIVTGIMANLMFSILLRSYPEQILFEIEGLFTKIVVCSIEIALNWIFSKYYVFKSKEPCL